MPKKEFLTIDEVAKELGIHRTSVYPYLNQLHIERRKFKMSRHFYISATDFERIKQVRAEPWRGEDQEEGRSK